MSRSLFNKIVVFCVVLFLLILAPQEINRPNQGTIRAVCTGLAIDTATDGSNLLNVTAQVLIPKAGGQYEQTISLVNGEGWLRIEFQIEI